MTDTIVDGVLAAVAERLKRDSRTAEYRTNPRAWAKDVLGIDLWSKQEDMFNSVRDNVHTAVRSCHGSGKSFNAALVACWWISIHAGEDAIVVSTAPTYHQVHSILWENIRKFHFLANERYEQGLSPIRLPGYVTMGDKWIGDSGEELGFGRKPADNNDHGFQGIHRRYVLVLIDEACGIKESLFVGVEAITTTEDSRILAIGNPDDPATQFNKFFTSQTDIWHGIDISSFDSPNFTREHEGHYSSCSHHDPKQQAYCQARKWAERWDRDKALNLGPDVLAQLPNHAWVNLQRSAWGEDSPLWASKVLGQFPLQSVNTLFSRETLNQGHNTTVKPRYRGKRVLGVDLARFGPDYSVVYLAEEGDVLDEDGKPTGQIGKKVRLKDFWGGKADEVKADGMESALRVHNLAQNLAVDEVRIDGEGIGGPIRDRILQLSEGGYTVISVLGSSASPDRYRWGNARTYRFDKVREEMYTGLIDIDFDDKKLENELEMIQFTYKNRWNSMQVESKDDIAKRGLKSPDYADALIYALAPDLDSLVDNPLSNYRGGETIAINVEDFLGWASAQGQFSPY